MWDVSGRLVRRRSDDEEVRIVEWSPRVWDRCLLHGQVE